MEVNSGRKQSDYTASSPSAANHNGTRTPACAPEETVSLTERVRRAAREIEARIILEALEHHRWNRRRAAEALNISYRSLMYKMKHCNLRADGARRGPDAP